MNYKNKNVVEMKITRFDEHACMNYKNKNVVEMKITRFDEHS